MPSAGRTLLSVLLVLMLLVQAGSAGIAESDDSIRTSHGDIPSTTSEREITASGFSARAPDDPNGTNASHTGEPGAPPDGTRNETIEPTGLVAPSAEFQHQTHLFTVADLVFFGYADSTEISGPSHNFELDAGEARSVSASRGVYTASGSKRFAVLGGDPISGSVVGYYGVNQDGFGLGTKIRTWIPSHVFTDEAFIVFGYTDDTQVTITNSETGTQIWSGTLDRGERKAFEGTDIPYRTFVTVESSDPVAALSYFDQGYYVPAANGGFAGERFHTYAAALGGWTNDLVVNAFQDDTQVTITDTDTGDTLWSGTLDSGESHVESFDTGSYVTVTSSDTVTTSVQPWRSWESGGPYHESLYVPSRSGSLIGTDFVEQTLENDYLYVFAYENDTEVRLLDSDTGDIVSTHTLDAGEFVEANPGFGSWRIQSGKPIAIASGYGEASAEFAPVEFGESEAATVAGRVLDGEDQPVGGTEVYVYETTDLWRVLSWALSYSGSSDSPPPPTAVATGQTSVDGSFEVSGLNPGRYVALAVPPSELPHQPSVSSAVWVGKGETASVDITVETRYLGALDSQMAAIASASEEIIREDTRAAAEVYVDAEQVFNQPDYVGLLLTATDLALGAATELPEHAATKTRFANDIVGFLGDLLAAKGLADATTEVFLEHGMQQEFAARTAEARQTGQLEGLHRYTSAVNKSWLINLEHTGSVDQAVRDGYRDTRAHRKALERIDGTQERYEEIATEQPASDFSATEAKRVLETQEAWLRGNGPAPGVVISPLGNVYFVAQTKGHRDAYYDARRVMMTARSGKHVSQTVSIAGTAVVPLRPETGVALKAAGLVGEAVFTHFETTAKNRAADRWVDTQVYWARDLNQTSQVNRDIVTWLDRETDDPTLPYVDGEVRETDLHPWQTVGNKQIVLANRPDNYPWWWTLPEPHWAAVKNNTVTVEHTGTLPEAEARVMVVDQYGSDRLSKTVGVYPSANDPPMTLSPGERRDVKVPYTAEVKPFNPLQWHYMSTVLWIEGETDMVTDTYFVAPSADFDILPVSRSNETLRTEIAQTKIRTDAYALTTADSVEGEAMTTGEFVTLLGSTERVIDRELDPSNSSVSVTYTTNASINQTTFVMSAGSGDVNLHVYDASSRHVGYEPPINASEVQIPGASYTGPDSNPEVVTINQTDQRTYELTVNATGFSSTDAIPIEVHAIETPARPPVTVVSPTRLTSLVSPNRSTERDISIGEVGGQQAIEGLSVNSTGVTNANGTSLPDVEVRLSANQTTVPPGDRTNATLVLDAQPRITVPPGEPTRFNGTVTLETDNGGSMNISTSVLALDTTLREVALTGGEASITGVRVRAQNLSASENRSTPDPDLLPLGTDLATYRVEVDGQGQVTLRVDNLSRQSDRQVVAYAANGTGNWTRLPTNATVNRVSFSVGPGTNDVVILSRPIVVGSTPPADLDDDGLYENVNGVGELDIGDVQGLYQNMEDSSIQNHVDAFDFNGNGRIDIGDVQTLYREYLAS